MVLQEEQTVASPASLATCSCSSSSCEDRGLRRLGIGRERERYLGEIIKICVKNNISMK